MAIPDWVRQRLRYWRSIIWRPIVGLVLSAYTVLQVGQFIRSELSPEQEERWKIFRLLPHWDWYWWLVLALVALCLLILEGAYRLHIEKITRIKGLENMFDVFERDRAGERATEPTIFWQRHRVRQVALQNDQGEVFGTPYVAQIFFANQPQRASHIVAKQVAAHLTFRDKKGNQLFKMFGRWADNPQVAQAGNLRNLREIDIAPNGLPVCLDIALKYEEDVDCFGYNDDSVMSDPLWRDPAKRLPPGKYLIEIELRGLGVIHKARAVLNNKGIGEPIQIGFADESFTEFRQSAASTAESRPQPTS